jgi:alpha-L-fucosidase
MRSKIFIFLLLTISICSCIDKSNDSAIKTEKINSLIYQPNWESLSTHEETPEWLEDAKLGIYFHWGVYSVPAFG